MQVPIETLIAVALPAATVIVWLVRLEGRINLSDARYTDIKDSLARIETKTDRLRSFIGGGPGAGV